MKSKFSQQNILEKIVVSVGVGKLRNQTQFDDKVLPEVEKELALLTGQKAARRGAKKSIASFKTRTGDIVGLQVTLRRKKMNDFLNKVIRIVLPRVKDFRGIDIKNVDEHGNLNVGFREYTVFPEIVLEKSRVNFGVQMTCVSREKDRNKAIEFYRSVGVPFKKS